MLYAFIPCLFNLHIYCCAVQKINISKAISSSLEESMLVLCVDKHARSLSMCTVCINSIYSLDNRGVYFCIQNIRIRSTSNVKYMYICLYMWIKWIHAQAHIHWLTECGIHYFFLYSHCINLFGDLWIGFEKPSIIMEIQSGRNSWEMNAARVREKWYCNLAFVTPALAQSGEQRKKKCLSNVRFGAHWDIDNNTIKTTESFVFMKSHRANPKRISRENNNKAEKRVPNVNQHQHTSEFNACKNTTEVFMLFYVERKKIQSTIQG